jgi:hypothetical protein
VHICAASFSSGSNHPSVGPGKDFSRNDGIERAAWVIPGGFFCMITGHARILEDRSNGAVFCLSAVWASPRPTGPFSSWCDDTLSGAKVSGIFAGWKSQWRNPIPTCYLIVKLSGDL